MNQHRYTKSTTQSWGSRLAGSIKGVFLGFILFLISFVVLWWNEGRAVKTAEGLTEGAGKVTAIFSGDVDPSHEGDLVHLVGNIVSDDTITDDVFNISSSELKLRRKVEMYQWVENTSEKKDKNLGGSETTTTTYDYVTEWKSGLINSNNFEVQDLYINPKYMPYEDSDFEVADSKIGAFNFSEELRSKMNNYKGISLVPFSSNDNKWKKNRAKFNRKNINYNDPEYDSYKTNIYEHNYYSDSIVTSKFIFIGDGSPQNPKIGDVKITFSQVFEEKVSIVAQQSGNELIPFKTEAGTTISLLEKGDVPAEQMFEAAQSRNTTLTWILRFVGYLMMFFGITKCFNPLVILADVVPFIGSILGGGISFFAAFAAFGLSLITIAIAWIAYRPILAFSLLGIAAASIIFIFIKNKKKTPKY